MSKYHLPLMQVFPQVTF